MDIENRKSQYRQSGDVRFAALAIGESLSDPPAWAIEACRRYRRTEELTFALLTIGESSSEAPQWAIKACQDFADADEISVVPYGKKGMGRYESDSKLLVEIAEHLLRSGTLRGAIVKALGNNDDLPAIRRLERLWIRASSVVGHDLATGKKIYRNRWTQHVRARWAFAAIKQASSHDVLDFETAFLRLTRNLTCHSTAEI